jgi:hypothetical protein
MNNPCLHLPTLLPWTGFAHRPYSENDSGFRYYEGSDSRRSLDTPTGLPAYLATLSEHSIPNHTMSPKVGLSVATLTASVAYSRRG